MKKIYGENLVIALLIAFLLVQFYMLMSPRLKMNKIYLPNATSVRNVVALYCDEKYNIRLDDDDMDITLSDDKKFWDVVIRREDLNIDGNKIRLNLVSGKITDMLK
jgi:hypothetical protein